jgi:serine phosphatase RsbU (regulator of sigma subunit)
VGSLKVPQPPKKKTTGSLSGPTNIPAPPSTGADAHANADEQATISAQPITPFSEDPSERPERERERDRDGRDTPPRGGPRKPPGSAQFSRSRQTTHTRQQIPTPERSHRAREDSGEPERGTRPSSKRPTARAGQIGSLKLRGMPLVLKLSIPISLLVVGAMAVFGYVAVNTTQSRLNAEIVNSGYGQLQALMPFAERVMIDLRADKKTFEQKKKVYQDALQKVLESNPRLYDIAIFASEEGPVENPRASVLQGRDVTQFGPPTKERISVHLQDADQEVAVYRGSYSVRDAGGAGVHIEPVLFFRRPIREGPKDKDPERFNSTLNLVLSAKEIDDEVRALKYKLLLLGVILAASAVGVSLALSRYTTGPVKALVNDMNEVARGRLEHTSPIAESSTDEVGLLAQAFNQMTASLRASHESERENQRIAGELNTAKAIHIKLMPEKLPQLPGIDIFTAYQSAKEVGGDYYDFIPVGDTEHLALCVADVSGKGIPGSMVMGTTRTILRMMAVGNLSPADVLAKTNYHVARDIKRGMFVTCVYCVLNVRTLQMAIASAGHNPMLLYRQELGTVEKIRPNGIALGFDKGPVFNKTIREERIELKPGDRVVLYTDGVVEAMNEARVEWSEEALDAFTLAHAQLPSKEFVRLLIKALDDHKGAAEQHDDITITTFRIV